MKPYDFSNAENIHNGRAPPTTATSARRNICAIGQADPMLTLPLFPLFLVEAHAHICSSILKTPPNRTKHRRTYALFGLAGGSVFWYWTFLELRRSVSLRAGQRFGLCNFLCGFGLKEIESSTC
jgi:hypothetical protein